MSPLPLSHLFEELAQGRHPFFDGFGGVAGQGMGFAPGIRENRGLVLDELRVEEGRLEDVFRDLTVADTKLAAGRKEDARAGGEDLIVLGTHIFDLMLFFKGKPKWCMANIAVDGRRIALSPGMNVSAEIRTGKRRVIDVGEDLNRLRPDVAAKIVADGGFDHAAVDTVALETTKSRALSKMMLC